MATRARRAAKTAAGEAPLTAYYPANRRRTRANTDTDKEKALRPPRVPSNAVKGGLREEEDDEGRMGKKQTQLLDPQAALLQQPAASTPSAPTSTCSPRKRKTPTPPIPAVVHEKRPATVRTARRQLDFAEDGGGKSSSKTVETSGGDTVPQPATSCLPPLPVPAAPKSSGPKQVRNLAALRAQLARCSEAAQRLNELESARERQELALHKVHISPVKVRKKDVQASPDKPEQDDRTSIRPPAHQRYADLAEDSSRRLALPAKHKLLHEMFRSTDTVVALVHARNELCTFEKVKPAVQALTKRTFTMRNVGQFKTVYPESYTYTVQKRHRRYAAISGSHKVEWDFVMNPCFDNDLLGYKLPVEKSALNKDGNVEIPATSNMRLVPTSPRKTPCKSRAFLCSPMKVARASPGRSPFCNNDDNGDDEDGRKRLTGARQVYRAAIFRRRLVEFVKRCHEKFLASLSPPVSLADSERNSLRRWHPQFDLDKHVAELPVAELPRTPDTLPVNGPTSARDVLAAAKVNPLPKRLSDALEDVNGNETPPPPAAEATDANAKKSQKSQLISNLKGLPPALLAKIRAKQTANELVEMSRDPEAERRSIRLARLPDFVRILRALYLSENKGSLPIATVTKKLSESYDSMIAADEFDKHIDLLIELLPDWISKHKLGKDAVYVRVKKETAVNGLIKVLQQAK